MLRIITSASVNQAKKYYSEGLTREGYYSQGQEMAGEWGGLGSLRLGLHGMVDKETFISLCDNLHPDTGLPLTSRQKDNRRVGYDFNFNAPKSVTLAYEWTKDERILKVFRESVRETMEELELEAAARVRTGGRNEDRTTGNLTWAEFIHFTARPVDGIPDPHLHAHCFAFNATFDDQEDKWKAAQFGNIKFDASYYEAAFRARLANGLRELGLEIEPVGGSFELGGVSRSLIEKFSRRAAVVKSKEKELGITSAEERDGLAALTRERKVKDLSRNELHTLWWEKLTPDEERELNGLKQVLEREATLGWTRPSLNPELNRQAVSFALEHIFERASVVTERELITEALKWGYGRATLAGVKGAVQAVPLIRTEQEGIQYITTQEVLEEENRMVVRCQNGRGHHPAIHPGWTIQNQLLNSQQKEAVLHVLRSRDLITGISGKAGTGKTTLLHEAKRGIEAAGQRLYVFAPTAEAARVVLRSQGFEQAETVAQLLASPYLQEQAAGAVWWVDEAGLLSSHVMDQFLRLADRLQARVVLVGDIGQHHAVERGQAFDLLQKFGGMSVASVEKIQRQKGAYKRAVEQIADRNFEAAFDTLEQMGAFRVLPMYDLQKELASDYLCSIEKGQSALVVSPTHAECEAVTHAIRQNLKESGVIREGCKWKVLHNLTWTAAQKRDPRSYEGGQVVQINKHLPGFALGEQLEVIKVKENAVLSRNTQGIIKPLPLESPEGFSVYRRDNMEICPADRIRITANGRTADGHRLNNGSLFTVKSISPHGRLVLDNNWELEKGFGHLDYGYATTSHASQGKTVDHVIVAQSGLSSSGASDANQFYVSVSRGRKDVHIYTDDIDALRENVARVRERKMALEVVPAPVAREAANDTLKEYSMDVMGYSEYPVTEVPEKPLEATVMEDLVMEREEELAL